MSVHVIAGKPGSGKSLYSVHRVIEQLRTTRRNIVTNLPLDVARLNEFLQEQYPDEDCQAVTRITLLSDEQTRTFWEFRGDPMTSGFGVAFFIDEAHIPFNARDWAQLGRQALHYLSQHRKLGDMVFAITQAPGNLDKQFRSIAQDFAWLRNERTAVYGPFRGRDRFVVRFTADDNPKGEPFLKQTFNLDPKGVASCYDTAKGIGVGGTQADKGAKAKGWSIWWVVPIAACLALLTYAVPSMLGKAAQKALAGPPAEARKQITPPPAASLPKAPQMMIEPKASQAVPSQKQITARGVVYYRNGLRVALSDGTTLDETEVARVTTREVWLRTGEKIPRSVTPPPILAAIPQP